MVAEGFAHHVQDGLQDEVYVDGGETRPVVHRSNAAVVFPEEGPGQLVQSRALRLLWDTRSQLSWKETLDYNLEF